MQKNIGTCRLCRSSNVQLKRGHVIPEWAYRLGGLNESTMMALAHDMTATPFSSQNASLITDYLFCGSCEEWLGEGEDELKRTFFSSNSQNDKTSSVIQMTKFPYFEVSAPKRKLIERAIVGIIFKGHFISGNLSIFNDLTLSKTQFRRFQKALLKGGPESDNFDFLDFYFFKLFSFRPEINAVEKGVLSTYQTVRYAHNVATLLVFAGLVILVYYKTGKNQENSNFKVRLADIEDFGFPHQGYPNHDALTNPHIEPILAKRLHLSALIYSDSNSCPCGLSWTKNKKVKPQRRTYGDCCKQKWFYNI